MKYNPALLRPGWQEGFVTDLRAGDVLDFSGLMVTITWMDRRLDGLHVILQAEANLKIHSRNSYGWINPNRRDQEAIARLLDLQLPALATVRFRRPIDPPAIALARELFPQIFGRDVGGWDGASYANRGTAVKAAETAIKTLGKVGAK